MISYTYIMMGKPALLAEVSHDETNWNVSFHFASSWEWILSALETYFKKKG